MAELVRRAIDAVYRPKLRPIVGGFQMNVGLLKSPDAATIGRLATKPRRILD